MSDHKTGVPDEISEVIDRPDIDEPNMYRVILHNDDYTTMDFVVEVLMVVFRKTAAESTKIMLDVHNKGRGAVGIFTYDIAVSKIEQVYRLAKTREFPLRCSYEEV